MKKYVKFFLTSFLISSSSLVYASSSVQREADDILNVQTGFAGNSSTIDFRNEGLPGSPTAGYESNTPGKIGVSLGYRNLGLGLSASTPPDDTTKKGESQIQDYSLRLLGRNTFNFGYQYTKGFYQKSSADASTGIYQQKPDMQVKRLSFMWMHNFFHEDLSLPAVFNYSGRQLTSGWTALTFVQLNRSSIEDSSAIISSTQAAQFPILSPYKKFTRDSVAAGVGLAGALVYESFQIGTLVSVGGSLEEKTFTDTMDVKRKDSSGGSPVNIFLNAGYNGKKHQVGASFFFNSYNTKLGSESINDAANEVRFFYGYRFDGVNLGGFINGISAILD